MNNVVPDTLTVLPDPSLFRAARWTQRICLGVAAIAIVLGLMPLAGVGLGGSSVAVARGNMPVLLTGLLCGIALLLSEPERSEMAARYGARIASLLAVFAAAVVVFWTRAAQVAANHGEVVFPSASVAAGVVVLTVAVVLLDGGNWLANLLVDVLVCGLGLLSLLLVSDAVLAGFAIFGKSGNGQGSSAALICLVALTAAVSLRQAEHGVFSIFLGVGVGSKLARIFAPVLLLLPFAWEAGSAWINHAGLPGHLSAASMASTAVAVAVGILLFFAWRISRMENQIHDLILRDEATRLYNFRGFNMLAEHALRLAQRSNVPFSVLFIDFENLAQIHEQLGPDASAASLREAGEILRATFRESDIKGRISGDEFAVAGQFDFAGISVAAMRLEAATAARSAKSARPIPLKFSMGHVTTSGGDSQENLRELLDRAGQVKNRMDLQMSEMLVN